MKMLQELIDRINAITNTIGYQLTGNETTNFYQLYCSDEERIFEGSYIEMFAELREIELECKKDAFMEMLNKFAKAKKTYYTFQFNWDCMEYQITDVTKGIVLYTSDSFDEGMNYLKTVILNKYI